MAGNGAGQGEGQEQGGQGDRPTYGVRFAVERATVGSEGVVYRGHAHVPGASWPLEVRVALPGGATIARFLDAGVPDAEELQKAAAALVRAATKVAAAAGKALPRKIVRWRG